MRPRLAQLHLPLYFLFFETSWAWVARARNTPVRFGSRRQIGSARRKVHVARMKVDEASQEETKLKLKLLLIDHYDSFTYNLVDLLSTMCHEPPTVIAADSYRTWTEFQQTHNSLDFDGIVLSPGPGHPSDDICSFTVDCVRHNPQWPILGVCLGHQILGHVYGATIQRAPEPIHGQIKGIRLLDSAQDDCLWQGIEWDREDLEVMRYHSLQVTHTDTTELVPTAISDDAHAVLMAMRHSRHLHFGVQFHPESIGTQMGPRLVRNFVQLCMDSKSGESPLVESSTRPSEIVSIPTGKPIVPRRAYETTVPSWSVYVYKVPDLPPNGANMQPIDVMEEVLKDEDFSYWLDSSRVDGVTGRTSILGATQQRVEYWGYDKPINQRGVFVWDESGAVKKDSNHDILSYLDQHHGQPKQSVTMLALCDNMVKTTHCSEEQSDQLLPFQFRGGHVGYLGYEVRHDTLRYLLNETQGRVSAGGENDCDRGNPNVPTAAFLWAEKSFVYDHCTCDWYLVQVKSNANHHAMEAEAFDWIRSMTRRLQQGRGSMTTGSVDERAPHRISSALTSIPSFAPSRTRQMYNRNFDDCIQHIRNGESYELCLTNQFEALCRRSDDLSVLDLYTILRRRNPAPFSAFFNWNGDHQRRERLATASSFALCCSSPERFLSVKRKPKHADNANQAKFQVEAKPIKGTIARVLPGDGRVSLTSTEQAEDDARVSKLQSSVKDRAENLMIVDLLRHDLNRVCETGSVHVSNLTAIESFATVHQMVSTIRGTLNQGAGVVDVLKACFPGGSMTGAPKRRTVELLDEMEQGVSRGPYSGCLGYISVNGCMDMNIVIRTAVLSPIDQGDNDSFWNVNIGAGGAITALSQSADEYDEMMLKASAIMQAVNEWVLGSQSNPSTTNEVNASQQNASIPV